MLSKIHKVCCRY